MLNELNFFYKIIWKICGEKKNINLKFKLINFI